MIVSFQSASSSSSSPASRAVSSRALAELISPRFLDWLVELCSNTSLNNWLGILYRLEIYYIVGSALMMICKALLSIQKHCRGGSHFYVAIGCSGSKKSAWCYCCSSHKSKLDVCWMGLLGACWQDSLVVLSVTAGIQIVARNQSGDGCTLIKVSGS